MSTTRLVSAADFLTIIDRIIEFGDLSNGESEPIVEVVGGVDLIGCKFPRGLRIERVHFRHTVRMNNCEFGYRVQFKRCTFYDHLDLTNARFSDGIAFEECRFEVPDPTLTLRALSLSDASITGNVTLLGTTVYGCISAKRLRLAGDFTFGSCTIEGNSQGSTPIIDLSESEIIGSVNFESYAVPEISTPSAVIDASNKLNQTGKNTLLQRSTFFDRSRSGSVTLRRSKVTDVNLAWAHFCGEVNLQETECVALSSNCHYFACRPGDTESWPGESFGGAKIEGELTLSGGTFALIRLSGILIKGFLTLIDGQSGQIQIDDGLIRTDRTKDTFTFQEIHIVESEIHNLGMVTWRCSDHVHIHVKCITGEPNEWGLQGVRIKNSQIHGDLSFWPGGTTARELQQFLDISGTSPSAVFVLDDHGKLVRATPRFLNRWRRRLRMSGALDIDTCTVEGDIILTGVSVENFEDGRRGGRIVIRNSVVAGEVKFASPISYVVENGADRLPLLLARWFVAREQTYRLLLQKIREPGFSSSDVAALATASPALARELLHLDVLTNEIASVSHTNADHVRTVLLDTEISRDELAQLIAAREESDENGLNEIRTWMANLPDYELPIYHGRATSNIVAAAISLCKNLPSEIVELLHGKVEDFKAEHAFEQATCSAVDMDHLSTAKLDLAGLRVREPLGDEVRERRVNLHYAKVTERLDTFVRLEKRAIDEVWKELGLILLPAASDRGIRSVAQAFGKGRSRERDVLAYCFGEDEIKFLESIPKRGVELEPVELSVDIPGALDMLHAEIDELYLSDKPFRDTDPGKAAIDHGVVLDYAKISKFYVARGMPRKGFAQNGFPVPLSLLNLSVRAWFLEEPNAPRFPNAYTDKEATTADSFLDLLDNDPEFRASAYLEIERLLRNRGLEEQANRVFIAGYYRDVRIGFEDEGFSDEATKKQYSFKALSRWWRTWRPGDGRYRRKVLIPVFRLKRPVQEPLGFGLCFALLLAFCYLAYTAATAALANDHGKIVDMAFCLMILLVLAFGLMRHAIRLFLDRLFWSVLDYGTSALRLSVVIFLLAMLSFLFISGDRRNFEPTLAAEIADAQTTILANTQHGSKDPGAERKWNTIKDPMGHTKDQKIPKEEYWPLGERGWMTLRYHMPLVSAIMSDEWQPADRPLVFAGFVSKASWWPFDLRARDWFGIMLWANWILWPLFLPYLIRRLIRNRE